MKCVMVDFLYITLFLAAQYERRLFYRNTNSGWIWRSNFGFLFVFRWGL